MNIKQLPYGSLIKYKDKLYFKQKGLDGDILTASCGNWRFIHKAEWKNFEIIYMPDKNCKH